MAVSTSPFRERSWWRASCRNASSNSTGKRIETDFVVGSSGVLIYLLYRQDSYMSRDAPIHPGLWQGWLSSARAGRVLHAL